MSGILHIAPQLPPAVDGVGDYCFNLWRHSPAARRETTCPPWQFAVLRDAVATRAHWRDVEIHAFQPTAASLANTLETARAETVVLHYVSYGYQPKGMPLWLPKAIAQWKSSLRAASSTRRVVTMFHEMYATSSPLRSPFWVAPFARRIMRRLVGLSDTWITSCDRYFDWLVREFAADPARGRRIPIGSNVPGHPGSRIPGTGRLRLTLFGLPNTRVWALERHVHLISALVAAQSVDSIQLLGKRPDTEDQEQRAISFQQRIGGTWKHSYDLRPDQIAVELAKCDVGFVANDAGILTKSGVFAAMAANGVITIASNRDGYTLRKPFDRCVLLNDDSEAAISRIIDDVTDRARRDELREATLRAAEEQLSWNRIAEAWSAIPAIEGTASEARVVTSRPRSGSGITTGEGLARREMQEAQR